MEHNDTTILGSIDPEITERLITRREAIRKTGAMSSTMAAGLAMASAPIALAALSREVFGQSAPPSLQTIINFALALEIFEYNFYSAVLGTSASPNQNLAFAPVRAMVPATALPAIQLIQQHENEHVAFLTSQGAMNTLNLTADSFDFTGGQGSGTGPFASATTDLHMLLLVAQGAEDTGVRAYKGQAPNIQAANKPAVLEAALRIHSVEARHASKIRRLRRLTTPSLTGVKYSGTITGGGINAAGAGDVSNPPTGAVNALTAIYAGEDNVLQTQANVNITTLPNLPSGINVMNAATEAFDEPLSMSAVIAIVQPFFIPNVTFM